MTDANKEISGTLEGFIKRIEDSSDTTGAGIGGEFNEAMETLAKKYPEKEYLIQEARLEFRGITC